MTTVIEIYPHFPNPSWAVVGAIVEVLGEGRGCLFRIVEVQSSRVAVVSANQKDDDGGCWESLSKVYRPDHYDEDLKHLDNR